MRMEQLDLAGTGRLTTRLGFGCSNLMGSMSRKESIALLDAAWDAGIRHIDVAPFYGRRELRRRFYASSRRAGNGDY